MALSGAVARLARTDGASNLGADEQRQYDLLFVPLDGRPVNLSASLVGVPVSDPVNDRVTWAELTASGVKLVAYDTSARARLTTLAISDKTARVFAIDGSTAYVATRDGFHVWKLNAGTSRLEPLPPHIPPGIVGDADANWAFVTDESSSRLVDPSGLAVKTFEPGFFASFSPEGSMLAGIDDSGRPVIWRRANGEIVEVALPADVSVVTLQWSPQGSLVALTSPDPSNFELSGTYYTCEPLTGICGALPAQGFIDTTQALVNDAPAQFAEVFGYG